MERQAAYAGLARWFEYLNDDCDYEKWSQYLLSKIKPYACKKGLDVGCGGGYFTRFLQRQGYQMTGVDVSAQMLSFAQEKALKDGVRSEYLVGDITKTKFPKRFEFVTAINDCINYIPKEKLISAFKNVSGALVKGGVFFFDVSSKRKFLEKIANTVSADDRDDVTYLSFNSIDGDCVTMDVTVFSKRDDGAFDRTDEKHVQYIYTEDEIADALSKCGFEIISVEGFLGEDKNQSDRICFLAQRK